ncbi:MAG: energy-coupling factor ABC transporter permease [Chloroflexota bacterium]
MHISEGVLPAGVAAVTAIAAAPFVAKGVADIKKKVEEDPKVMPLVGLVSAAVFVVSVMPLPAPTGTSAHPTAIAIAAIILGPWAAAFVTAIVLGLQALLLAHGGVTTLGANVLNMGVFGAFTAYFVYRLFRDTGLPLWVGLVLAGGLGDLVTYLGTSVTMGVALGGEQWFSFSLGVFVAFLPVQIVLVPLDALFTLGLFNFIRERRPDLAERLGLPLARV